MKILCVSDYVDPMIYNPKVKELFSDIDMILCAGDLPMDYVDFIVSVFNLPTYFIFGNHNLNDFHMYHKSSDSFNGIRINPNSTHSFHGGTYIGFKTLENKDFSVINPKNGKKTPLLLLGLSGSISYNKGLNQYTDRQMFWKILKLVPKLFLNKLKYGRYVDIFLTHASPRHIHDHEDPCHLGFECFNWFLKKFHPAYMVHGHIHLYDMRETRVSKHYGTVVVNAYAHHVIEFPIPETDENSNEVENSDSSENQNSNKNIKNSQITGGE